MIKRNTARGTPAVMDFSAENDAFKQRLFCAVMAEAAKQRKPVPLDDHELEFLNAAGDTATDAEKRMPTAGDSNEPRR